MPAVNQDFTIHDLDRFQVRFNVTDAEGTLDTSDAKVWWGVADNSASSTIHIQRAEAPWADPGGGLQNVSFGSTAQALISPQYIDIIVSLKEPVAGLGGSVDISPSSFPDTYYHECIFGGTNDQMESTGIATGTITVLQSLFTEQNYRK